MGRTGVGQRLSRMIPAGDFVLNASLVLGRLTYLPSQPRRPVALEYAATVFLGSRTIFDQVYKGHCGETPRSLFFGGWRGKKLVCHLTIFLQHE